MKKAVRKLKKYFIPHEENDHKPHILRARSVAFVIILAVVIESVFVFGSSYLAPRSKLFGLILVNALVDGTNAARTDAGLPALRENALLDAAAQDKANDMVANDYFAHTSPSGTSPWYWFIKAGYNFSAAGENLAVNFADSSDVTNAWLNSPEHRANIMDAGYTDIGMATAQGTFQGVPAIYVVELFGTPSVPFAPAPIAQATHPATTPKSQPVPKPVVTVTSAPTAVSVAIASDSAAVAVQGAQIVTLPATTTGSTTVASAPQSPSTAQSPAEIPSQTNFIQKAASAPRQVVDYIYLGIAILFAIALLLNFFIKIRIQHPQIIFGGMLVILVAGLFIVLNQHFGLGNAVVL